MSTTKRLFFIVNAGPYDRENCLVQAQIILPSQRSALEPLRKALCLTEIDEQGEPLGQVPAQLDLQGSLIWLLTGKTRAGQRRCYIADLEAPQSVDTLVDVVLCGDHLVVSTDEGLVTRYIFAGVWKPYLYPLMIPTGSVVRGASGEHQHQTGVLLGYGGHPHGDPSPANIWSDWDEPPYGPCGKMLHESFDLVRGGPVYGHIVERIGYIRPTGYKILDEQRDIRVYPLPDGSKILDITIRVPPPDDPGSGPFIVAARVGDDMRVWNLTRPREPDGRFVLLDPPGEILNSEGQHGPDNADGQNARWCDYSGKVGDGWGGIAILDHPDNHGFPGRYHAGGYGCLSVNHEYPSETPAEGQTTFRVRIYAHPGGAIDANVASKYHDFAEPPVVECIERLDTA